jgi:hypothetical protein
MVCKPHRGCILPWANRVWKTSTALACIQADNERLNVDQIRGPAFHNIVQ